ncbi:MAG: TonB family protein [Acidobacteriota bacterium]
MPKSKILLADYEPRSIKKIKELLAGFDCEIKVALNGIAALELFNEFKPDVVLMEAMLPRKHGFDVCLEIKKSPHGKRIPVIIATNVYKGRKYKNQAMHVYRCDFYIEKPCPDEVLLDVLKQYLPEVKRETPKSEKREPGQVIPGEQDERATITNSKKPEILEELEKEIESKVDEVLTLFAADTTPHIPRQEVSKGAKEKISEKKTVSKLDLQEEVLPEPEEKSQSVPPIETQAAEIPLPEKPEKTIPAKPALQEIFQAPEIHPPESKVATSALEISPWETPSEPASRRQPINFKMAIIGAAGIIFLAILIVFFPLLTGKDREEKRTKREPPPMKDQQEEKAALPEKALSVKPVLQEKPVFEQVAQVQPSKKPVTQEPLTQEPVLRETEKPQQAEMKTIATRTKPAVEPRPAPAASPKSEKKTSEVPEEPIIPPSPMPPVEISLPSKQPEVKEEVEKSEEPLISKPLELQPKPAMEREPEPVQSARIQEGDVVDYALLDRAPGYLAHELPNLHLRGKLKGIAGNVVLQVLIGTNGHVQEVKLIKGLEPSLDEAAINAAKNWVYRPPERLGIRVRTWKAESVPFPPKSN